MGGAGVVIQDKDGGLALELRAPKGDLPVYISPSGDRTNWNEVINVTNTGDSTIHTPASGKRFYVSTIVFVCGASGSLLVKSGTTNISGPMNFGVNGGMVGKQLDGLYGRAINDALILTPVSPMAIGGYAVGYDE